MALRRLVVVLALVVGLAPTSAATARAAVTARVSAGATAGATTGADVVVASDVVYGEAPDAVGVVQALRLDLYDPVAVPGWRPALVVVHGGGFDRGDKADPVYVAMARAFAAEGFLVASVDYRLRSDVYPDFPVASVDAQHDVQAAIRWLRAHAAQLRVDPGRIAVTGHSAGALTALRVATHPEDAGDSGTPDQPSTVAAALAVSGFLPGDLGTAAPPVRMLHGTADAIIPVAWAVDTCKRWNDAGGTCDLVTYAGGTHDATAFFDPASPEVQSFLACTVGGPVAFSDVPPATATARTVAWATGRGLLNGAVAGPLAPAAPVSRGRLATLLWRFAGRPPVDAAATSSGRPPVDWVAATGILHVSSDETFSSRRVMTHAAAATALWRMAGRPVGSPPAAVEGVDPTAPEARAVDWLVANGAAGALLADGTFRADAPLQQLQLLRVLRRLSATSTTWAGAAPAPCPLP